MSVKFSAAYDGMTRKNEFQVDIEAIKARRLPLSEKLEKQRKAEMKKWLKKTEYHDADYVYALVAEKEDAETIIFYIGLTSNYSSRWAKHSVAIFNGVDQKQAYIAARDYQANGYIIKMEKLGPALDKTEDEWVQEFRDAGAPLENEAAAVGNKRKRKKVRPT